MKFFLGNFYSQSKGFPIAAYEKPNETNCSSEKKFLPSITTGVLILFLIIEKSIFLNTSCSVTNKTASISLKMSLNDISE